jgi:tetratricopeptide (TPR) repeat protein
LDAEVLYAEATQAYQSKDFSRAIASYERLIALQPDHAEAYYKRRNALKDLGQPQAPLASYDAALQYKPDFQSASAWSLSPRATALSAANKEASISSGVAAGTLELNSLKRPENRDPEAFGTSSLERNYRGFARLSRSRGRFEEVLKRAHGGLIIE